MRLLEVSLITKEIKCVFRKEYMNLLGHLFNIVVFFGALAACIGISFLIGLPYRVITEWSKKTKLSSHVRALVVLFGWPGVFLHQAVRNREMRRTFIIWFAVVGFVLVAMGGKDKFGSRLEEIGRREIARRQGPQTVGDTRLPSSNSNQ